VTLPHGWLLSTLGVECDKPQYGWTASAKQTGEVKLLRTTDLTNGPLEWTTVPFCSEAPEELEKYIVKPNDLFISRAGSVGVSVLVENVEDNTPAVFASYLIRIRAGKNLLPTFLSLYLQSPQYWQQIRDLSAGATLANINAPKIKSISIPVPPLGEQQGIVATLEDHLSRLDKALAEVESSISRLREARLSWLQAEMAHLYDEGSLVQLSEVAESRLGKMLDAAKNVGVSTPYLRNINVQWGRIDCLDLDSAPMTQANLDELGLQLGDLLVCEGGEPGRCAIWTESHQTLGLVAFQKALHRVRAKAGYSTGFLALILEWHAKSGRLTPFITGTTIKHLPQEQLRKIPVPVIPLEQQRSLVAKYGTFIESQASIQSTLDKVKKQIRALKGSLLNLAFEGGLKD